MENINETLRKIPKLDKLLARDEFSGLNTGLLKNAARKTLDAVRAEIQSGKELPSDIKLTERIISEYIKLHKGSLYKVINATGVPIHTNLGRSPISSEILKEASDISAGYSNLEYDVEKGKRGDRYHHAAEYLRILTGAEDAVVVNNNASAVFLILNTFANKKSVIVSRGELVEIGGSFRVPDVMSRSGAKLTEVGTTNKTRITDYTDAVSANTAMMMKVHKSNYEIVGFSEEASLDEIAAAAKDTGVLSYYDAGSGLFTKTVSEAVCADHTIPEISAKGFDLISFSGDKMLGACQAGIIIGKSDLIKKIKKNPLMRMLRVDKLTLAILQATFRRYIENSQADIPVNMMLSADIDTLRQKAEKLSAMINAETEIIPAKSTIGGGSCPLSEIDSFAVALISAKKPTAVEKALRRADTPVIARIADERVILDIRTIDESEFADTARAAEGAI
jgi:L-seryl-tRNA(Ser) seleniumtransferase